ncbi:MAG TPA: methyltransferase domain-containing protein [Pyrinomonadaceae bacterium]|jgi:ubiquinone/menaquinone biosynthesis C-methylase UbiE
MRDEERAEAATERRGDTEKQKELFVLPNTPYHSLSNPSPRQRLDAQHVNALSPVSLFPSFRHRSYELEHLDKGDYTSEEYEGCLVELRRVNRYLGDTRALRRSLLPSIERAGLTQFSVLDVGAGSGELLRVIAGWASRTKRAAHLSGLELNARSARSILEESRDASAISALRGDALRLPFTDDSFDYVICSLFTHHFTDELVLRVLHEMSRVARRRIFVIDLHRHAVAYYFYTTVGRFFLHNRLLREDGALSILRSFRPAELRQLAQQAKLKSINVERRFPYRLVLSASKTEGLS